MTESNKVELFAMQTLIRLVSAGARGENVGNLCVDWAAVLPLAAEQSVPALVACALLHSPDLDCPADLREYLLGAMRTESSVNLIRRQRIMRLLAEMREQGIEARVIKGYAVADCYKYPECRGSADNDLLVDIRQEDAAIRFLEGKEFKVSIRGSTSHHSVCQHKKYGMLELHVALYAELIREIWFRGMRESDFLCEPFIEVNGDGGHFTTLGHTDQLIFLTLHMMKHFVAEGLTLRMMLDIALYFSANRQWIDADRFWNVMRELRYERLVNCVLWSMVEAGGFGKSEFPGISRTPPEQIPFVLTDLLKGGYMGQKEKTERHKSGMEYNRQLLLREKSQLQYMLYMLHWKLRSGLNAMFPTVHQLRKKYSCLDRNKYLLPLIWIWHVLTFPIKNRAKMVPGRDIRVGKQEKKGVIEQRMTLFKELGMLD